MQTQANQNAIQVARNILRHEGALAFYKVLLLLLLSLLFYLVLTVYEL
jgi:hypothetical protein